MKNWFLVYVSAIFMLSCAKTESGCEPVKPADEEAVMTKFATDNSIPFIKHTSGMLYQVVNPGYGVNPTTSSVVTVGYTGKLMNGEIFDQNTANPPQFSLSGLIEGWKIGLPLIKKGGTIRLIVPSSLAYGCTGKGAIAANSPLYFEIQLLNVQ